tara:strand:+ start:3015 stop:4250 length:1236 start_codon:yes stop_codon:yes gene_type:complete
MKKYIYIIFINLILSQSSSLSLYGLGEVINSSDAAGLSLGDSKLFSNNSILLSSPSTYHNNKQASLAMTMTFNDLNTNYINNLKSNNFNYVSFGFPITNNQYFMISLKPVLRSMMRIDEDEFTFLGSDLSHLDTNGDGDPDPVKYKSSYNFKGGMSEISASVSSKITDNFSLGLKFGKLFGTFTRKDTLNFYTVNFNNNGEQINSTWFGGEPRQNKLNYSSYSYHLDGRLQLKSDNTLAFYYGESDRLKIDAQYDNFDSVIYSIKGYQEYGLGFKSYIYSGFGYIIESQTYNAFNCKDIINIFNKPSLDMNSINYGIFYKDSNVRNININSINYSVGFYDKMYTFDDSEISLSDFGFTFGLGLEYLNNNYFNFALQFGQRLSEFEEFSNEEYYRLTFSIISKNNWFIKESE